MPKTIHILNGPNLNLLGSREPAVYGSESLDDIRVRAEKRAEDLGFAVVFRQSNHEGELVEFIHAAKYAVSAGIILNAGAFTHTSIAIMDALQAVDLPCVEVHLSNIFKREEFRHNSYISPVAVGLICGFGAYGYELAVDAIAGFA
jgi:3-dehydroquinate dehydratase-2